METRNTHNILVGEPEEIGSIEKLRQVDNSNMNMGEIICELAQNMIRLWSFLT
jgi:hypothetical protein